MLGAIAWAAEGDVKRGEYLARAGDCISCHSNGAGAPFTGGLPMQTPFGIIYTPNITPDKETGIGTMTADEFYRVMHEGVGQHGEYLYPVMPFSFYTKMTRKDVDAIHAYLQSLEPVSKKNRGNALHFPFDIRMSMLGWRELFFEPGTFEPDTRKSKQWNRGAYLVEGPGHCGACHSPRNVFGAIEKDRSFTGARIDDWFALNLTSDLRSGLGSWDVDEIADFLKTGTSRRKGVTALGPMQEVVHNSLQYLEEDDVQAIAVYIHALPTHATNVAALSSGDPHRREGARLYLDNCAMCHQPKGTGMSGVFPKLAGNAVVTASDPANLITVVMSGIPGRGNFVAMPSFSDKLSDDELIALMNYVRTSWGNATAPGVSAQMIRNWRVEHR
jgi:mono/diheme cytochrome c family protein